MYTSGIAAPECTTVALRLGAFIRDAVSGPESAMVTEHLSHCDNCRAVFAELSDVSLPLRAMVAPVFLGDSAAYYLANTPGTTARSAAAPVARATAGAAAGRARWLRPAALVRDAARPVRWLAAGGAAVIALGAIAFGVSLAGHGTPLKPADRDQAQSLASPQAPATTSQQSAAPVQSSKAPVVVRASASRTAPTDPAVSPSGSSSPAQPSATSPAPPTSPSPSSPVQLKAAVDVYGGHHHSVVFQVTNTGSAATGALVVSVALPAGTSLLSGHGNGNGNGGDDEQVIGGHPGHNGWTCKATSTGAQCSHAPIPAGGQSEGTISIAISSSSACGQAVSVTVASGPASASAQSPEDIQC